MANYSRGLFLHVLSLDPDSWRSSLESLDRVGAYEHVEVWLERFPGRSLTQELARLLEGRRIVVHGPFIHLSIATHLEALAELSLRRFEESLDVAAQIGAEVVTFHAGTFPFFEPHDRVIESVARRFESLAVGAKQTVTLENMPGRSGTTRDCLSSLAALEELGRRLPSLQYTFDVGHALQNGEAFEEFVIRNIGRIRNIHLHDGKRRGASHLRLGDGELDLAAFLTLLKTSGYAGFVGLETLSLEDTVASWELWTSLETGLLPVS